MERQTRTQTVNNAFYDTLHEGWYQENNHPIALLRKENAVRNPWIASHLTPSSRVLDIGCGGGLLTNDLAQRGHVVTGIDLSEESLNVARRHDPTHSVQYVKANALELPFKSGEFDAVMAMDILEHVSNPGLLIQEASRVLKSGGLFFFHTFNRTWLSYLLIIKGVEWFVRNTPEAMHVYPLFIQPQELEAMCVKNALRVTTWVGLRPALTPAFFQMLCTRRVPEAFSFCFSKSLATGYCGIATR